VTVLIQGESGTGKELVAQALHYHSARAAHPFIAVNCAAIPKELLESELFGHEKGAFTSAEGLKIGKFEQADKGTIFLDEIGDLEFNLQAKLLRILEDREVHRVGSRASIKIDVRIIAATNQDLQTAVKEKRFREDLYHRINVINFSLPPLRDRREDISLLCDYFLQRFNREFNKNREPENMPVISAPVLMALKNYSWPGNIRELENVIKRAVVLCPGETIMTEHLPPVLSGGADQQGGLLYLTWQITEKLKADLETNKVEANVYNRIILNVEKELFALVMGFTANNQLKTAEILGINRNTLRKKLKKIEDEQS
jgi:two-component system nitrogen regulation response regulator GlnG